MGLNGNARIEVLEDGSPTPSSHLTYPGRKGSKGWFYAIVVFQVKTPLTFIKFIMNKYKNDPLFMRVLEEGDSDVIEGVKFAGE